MANLKDFATGTVSSAPSPATSGTSLTLQSGEGARFPAVPFYATAHPDYQLPTLDNAEKILVTAKSTDTLTIVRAQGDTTAKSIAIGWRISNAVFAADLFNTSLVTGEAPSGSVNGSNTVYTVAAAFSTGSLRVFLNGQRLKPGAGNDYTENAAGTGFTMEYAPATGDVLLVDYNVGSTAISYGTNTFIYHETPTGSVNGSNTSFTTARGYVSGTLQVYINGLLQAGTTHVTESSPSAGTFTLDTAPLTGDVVRVSYQYSTSASGNADTVDGYQANDLMPIGSPLPYFGRTAPSANWLMAYGQNVSRTTYATLFQVLNPVIGEFTITIASPGVLTLTSHGLQTGETVYLTTTGALPTGLSANTVYYAIRIDANTLRLATTYANAVAGTAINTSGSQSGTHTLRWTAAGIGDGSTTFTIPDLRGRSIAGWDAMGGTSANRLTNPSTTTGGVDGDVIGNAGGAETHALTAAQNGTHSHTVQVVNSTGGVYNALLMSAVNSQYDSAQEYYSTTDSGSGTAHNNVPPTMIANYIIKAL